MELKYVVEMKIILRVLSSRPENEVLVEVMVGE